MPPELLAKWKPNEHRFYKDNAEAERAIKTRCDVWAAGAVVLWVLSHGTPFFTDDMVSMAVDEQNTDFLANQYRYRHQQRNFIKDVRK